MSKLNIKEADPRPPKHGWAPGEYVARCNQCHQHFIGDKRAYQCADCAYSQDSKFCDNPHCKCKDHIKIDPHPEKFEMTIALHEPALYDIYYSDGEFCHSNKTYMLLLSSDRDPKDGLDYWACACYAGTTGSPDHQLVIHGSNIIKLTIAELKQLEYIGSAHHQLIGVAVTHRRYKEPS